jgi:hypothetical protein
MCGWATSSRNDFLATTTFKPSAQNRSGKLSFVAKRRVWKPVIISVALVAAGIIGVAYWVWSGLNAAATLEPGMLELHLPSGTIAYLRRQAYFGKPSEVYISANPDFCAPYDWKHDYKLPSVIHGGSESPVLISYFGNTIIVHSPEPVKGPWMARPSSFSVTFEKLTPEVYATYVGIGRTVANLPKSWTRVEIPIGDNTCAL